MKTIILIGMPGAGKSTVGPILAGILGLHFKDTDTIIIENEGRELRTIVAEEGFESFLDIQRKVILQEDLEDCVVATGGSVVKSDDLMQYLKKSGRIVYLQYEYEVLEKRLAPDRRLARAGGQTFRQVFDERGPFYIKYADSIIECTGKSPEEIAREIAGYFCS